MVPKPRLTALLVSAVAMLLAGAAWSEPVPGEVSGGTGQRHRVYFKPSSDMLPTLEREDRLLVDTWPGTVWKRGDMVLVQVRQEQWLKRIVGLPGDRIAMLDGQIVLNGKPVAQRFDREIELPGEGSLSPQKARRLLEQLPGEARPHQILDLGRRAQDDAAEVVLGPDQFFLLGDNRDNSMDSRMVDQPGMGFGQVDRRQLIGRLSYRFWRAGTGFDMVALQSPGQ